MNVAAMMAADPYAAHLGLELIGEDPVRVAMTVEDHHLNFLGVTHGGALFSLADCVLALAANSVGGRAMAIDTHLALTGGSRVGDRLVATAETATRGRTLATYRVTVARGDERVVGLFTGTVYLSAE